MPILVASDPNPDSTKKVWNRNTADKTGEQDLVNSAKRCPYTQSTHGLSVVSFIGVLDLP
jgi:hypothetical protein